MEAVSQKTAEGITNIWISSQVLQLDYFKHLLPCTLWKLLYHISRLNQEIIKEVLQFKTGFIHLTGAWKYPIVLLWKTD